MTAAKQQTHDIGLIIIGDEILSGKREDRHFAQAKSVLAKRGLALSWVSYLGDSPERCVAALEKSFASNDLVFSFGGIGSTPDDHTRQSAAKALGLPLVLHDQARDLIALRCQESGQPLTAERLRMGEFPQGASIEALNVRSSQPQQQQQQQRLRQQIYGTQNDDVAFAKAAKAISR